jgi:hypothetical protein
VSGIFGLEIRKKSGIVGFVGTWTDIFRNFDTIRAGDNYYKLFSSSLTLQLVGFITMHLEAICGYKNINLGEMPIVRFIQMWLDIFRNFDTIREGAND